MKHPNEPEALKQKRSIADALRREMDRRSVTKAELARTMGTSRSQVDSILDGDDPALTLVSLARVSAALGLEPEIRLRAR